MVTNEERENRWPTPREFVDGWEQATDTQRLARAERIISDAQAASKCFVMAHDDLEHEAQWLRDQKFKVQVEMDKARAKVARVEARIEQWADRAKRAWAEQEAYSEGYADALSDAAKDARFDLRAALDGDA